MNGFSIVIITGLPATGKTTLSKELASALKFPLINKDDIKERLFDSLGWSDREWSRKLGMATFSLVYHLMDLLMAVGNPFIVESNFKHEFDTKKFLSFKKKYDFFPIQIVCETEGEILFERFKKRTLSGKRHPGHRDEIVVDEIKEHLLKAKYKPLQIGGEVIRVNTSDFDSLDKNALLKKIKEIISGKRFLK